MKCSIQICLVMLFVLTGTLTTAQKAVVQQRLFLVGDAGEMDKDKHPVCDWLKQHVNWDDSSNILVYLGDNIYPKGLPGVEEKGFATAQKVLDYQVSVVKDKKAQAIFIPGNHDWEKGKAGGRQQLNNFNNYIEALQLPNVRALPQDACAGPAQVLVGDKTVIVCMDSQWWLQQFDKPGIESDCDFKTEEEIIAGLKEIIATYPDRLIVLAMHHPFYSHSLHGGYYTIKQHIFPLTDLNPNLYIPLPVIGSIYPLSRQWFGNIQDLKHPLYKNFKEKVEAVTKKYPNVVHVSGHDHALQLLQKDSSFYIVSASGSKSNRVKMGEHSLFASDKHGFAVIEVMSDRSTRVNFYSTESAGLDASIFSAPLPTIPSKKAAAAFVAAQFPDSVMLVASDKFKSGGFRKFILGKNYRREWKTPVKVKVLNLAKEAGGLTPTEMGGGKQTRSLRLKNKDGKEYVLRQIQKNVTDAALPPDLRGLDLVNDLIADGVSASYPYAALSIPPLATAAGIPHADPQLVFVPKDPLLGSFIVDFENSFCLLEERNPTAGDKIWSTDKMEKKLLEDNDNTIDQHAALQARLLDMFVMDFDRHEDQWRWGAIDTGKGKTYFPIPRDRDQPFFISTGVIPYFVSRPAVSPQLQGFRPKARNINTFNFSARNFDRNYLNELNKEDWEKAATAFVSLMTDELISTSMNLQPAAIKDYSVPAIIEKLKKRRNYFVSDVMKYYRFISRTVTIYGSNKKELFDVERHEDGSVTVTVFKINKRDETDKKIYERRFVSSETKELRLFGLAGNDRFNLHGNGPGTICIRVIGGAGKDEFDIETVAAAGKTKLYDLSTEKNSITGNGRYRDRFSDKSDVHAFDMRGYQYNVLAPFISAAYNPDDGVYLGLSAKYTKQGFRKRPFAQLHQVSASHALATKAYRFNYNFTAVSIFSKTDLVLRATLNAPNNTSNFFMYGNETVFDKSKGDDVDYYRARFALADLQLGLRRNISSDFWLAAGPVFQYYAYDSSDNKNRLINQASINGLNGATLGKTKTYGGVQVLATLDNRNNRSIPSRGINWQTSYTAYAGLGKFSNPYSRLNTDMSFFISFNKRARVVIANRLGAGISFGDIEFYQAQYLSGTENLRGYRKFRYAGTKMLYHNLDLRFKLADFKTYFFPGSVGLLGFHDLGRVWVKNDNSKKWHQGYGGGIWLAPLSRFVITATYGYGDDGGLPAVSFGFQF